MASQPGDMVFVERAVEGNKDKGGQNGELERSFPHACPALQPPASAPRHSH